jgi:hypothetical protein
MTYIPTDTDDLHRHSKHCNDQVRICHIPSQYRETTDYITLNDGPASLVGSSIILLKKHRLKSDFFDTIRQELSNDGINECVINEEDISTALCYLCVKDRAVLGCIFIEKVCNNYT